MTSDQSKKIFSKDFLKQLTSIRINGNFGDIVMNPDGPDIVEYFRDQNPALTIRIHTNGGARNRDFWKRLAKANCHVIFALDGLEDTHHLYRQNTRWSTVIKNAKTFISAGGQATWQMIRFNHNQHQIEDCKKLSQSCGFQHFHLKIDSSRDTAPVFDGRGQLVHVLGNYQGETDFKILFHKKQTDKILVEDVISDRSPKSKINCEAKELNSIYISANGDVSPCCWTGFYPKTYGHGQYHQAANSQLIPMMNKNNALEHSLQECIEWFANVEKSWKISSYEQGRLLICDENCGI